MKKAFFLFLFFSVSIAVHASQIESNHSYFRNSNFLNDYEVTVKGYGDIKYRSYEYKETSNSINTDLVVNFDIQGKIEDGFKYGVQWTERFNNEFEKTRSFFGYISDSYYGKFEFGNTLAATEMSRIGGDSVSVGNGGVFGELPRYIMPSLTHSPAILKEGSLSNQMFGYYNSTMDLKYFNYFSYKEKINYYSPEYFGFQVLFSFTPNNVVNKKYMDVSSGANERALLLGDIASLGISYVNTFDNIGLAMSAISERNMDLFPNKNADKEKIEREMDISSNILGININYFSFTLGASFGILERDIADTADDFFKDATYSRAEYKDYAISYEFKNIVLSYNMFESKMEDVNKFSSATMALELRLAKNLSLYGEYTNFLFEIGSGDSMTETKGKLFLFGVLINFY